MKTVPEMVYNIVSSNRAPVARHKLIEDDYRAYRNVLHNRLTLMRAMGRTDTLDVVAVASSAPKSILEPYKSAVDLPAGYLYRSYLEGMKSVQSADIEMETQAPIVSIESPYQGMFHAPDYLRSELINTSSTSTPSYYTDLLLLDHPLSDTNDVLVYNEPDAVPEQATYLDVSTPLYLRVLNMLGLTELSNPRVGTPVMSTPKQRVSKGRSGSTRSSTTSSTEATRKKTWQSAYPTKDSQLLLASVGGPRLSYLYTAEERRASNNDDNNISSVATKAPILPFGY